MTDESPLRPRFAPTGAPRRTTSGSDRPVPGSRAGCSSASTTLADPYARRMNDQKNTRRSR
jgi:hypothetical protein